MPDSTFNGSTFERFKCPVVAVHGEDPAVFAEEPRECEGERSFPGPEVRPGAGGVRGNGCPKQVTCLADVHSRIGAVVSGWTLRHHRKSDAR